MYMSELRSGEIAIKRDLFDGLVDELTDALGWLLVIQEENPEALQRACGNLDAEQTLAQMSAVLGGRTFDKRYQVAESGFEAEDYSSAEDAVSPGSSPREAENKNSATPDDLAAWRHTTEEKKDEDTPNPKG